MYKLTKMANTQQWYDIPVICVICPVQMRLLFYPLSGRNECNMRLSKCGWVSVYVCVYAAFVKTE